MPEFKIDETLRGSIDEKIEEVLASDARLKSEIQDAGESIFVRIDIMPFSTVRQIFQMSDDIDAILSSYLPKRKDAPRWAQGFFLAERVIYSNMGGLDF